MFDKKLVKVIGLLVPFYFGYAAAEISPCDSEQKLASKTINTFEITNADRRVDNVDIEFWTRKCNDQHQLIATISPKTPGESSLLYLDTFAYQGIQPYRKDQDLGYFGELELRFQKSVLLEESSIPAKEGKIDYSKAVDIYLSCDDCDDATPKTFSLTPDGAGFFSSVTGTWYDPAFSGSGFNVIEATNGLFMNFYGYKDAADGQAQWLTSSVGPTTVKKGQTISLTIYEPTEGNGANFATKPASGNGITQWGTAALTFNSCSSGTIVLNGIDGQVTHNVVKLANIKNLICSE